MTINFKRDFSFSFAIFIFVFFIYFLSNLSLHHQYKHQVFMAKSFLVGRCNIEDYLPGYHDVFEVDGKRYGAFTPFPALLITPIVLVFQELTNQVFLSMIFGSLGSVVLFLLLKKVKISFRVAIFTVIVFAFGTIYWFSSVIASSWFFSHTIAVLCLLISLCFVFSKKFLAGGLFFGFAFASRYPIIASLPGLVLLIKALLKKKSFFKSLILFTAGFIPSLFLIFFYNYCRFGNIFETGYSQANLIYQQGINLSQFSFSFIPRNFYFFLFKGFDFIDKFPFLRPDAQGLGILFTSPILLYCFKAKGEKKIIFSLWVSILVVFLLVLSYFLTGWFQFGYRFSLDFLPFLMILVAKGLEGKITLGKIFLLVSSIFFNILGVYWGKLLGW